MKRSRALCAVMALVTLCGLPLAGCGPKTDSSPIALAIVVGRHANQNAFEDEVYNSIRPLVSRAIADGRLSIILADGKPVELPVPDANSTESVLDFIKSDELRAKNEELDLLEAIKAAGDSLRGSAGEEEALEKHMLVLDTGVSTKGRVDFRSLDLTKFEAGIIAEELLSQEDALPNLAGIRVQWVGFGDVAEPQALPDSARPKLAELWRAILIACGVSDDPASLTIDLSIRGSQANVYTEDGTGYPFVSTVMFEALIIDWAKEGLPLPDVGFLPNSHVFRNPNNAKALLEIPAQAIQQQLSSSPDMRLYLVGPTAAEASDGRGNSGLSQRRASRLKQTLISLGVPADQLIAVGVAQANQKATVYTAENEDLRRILELNGLTIGENGLIVEANRPDN